MAHHAIKQINGSAIHNSLETSFALSHMNIDFSLVKVLAPVELQPLGRLLSANRRESAERGSFHIIARRLGALFQGELPAVPDILKAYGTRASEIVEHTSKLPGVQNQSAKTLFADQLGIDSTSIWAAATSSPAALQMHLLACMLARIWSPQEATAIWAELVADRQRQIRNAAENGGAVNADGLAATAYVIEQSSLAEWDASARSWLEIADKAKKKQQVQARLIVDNLSVGISHIDDVDPNHRYLYQNVMKNYEEAISAMDKLIRGIPQRINSANALLGLITWHLYPDLVVLGSRVVDIFQGDNQVLAGGVATIGFAESLDHNQDGNPDGVYWSLPLANLRYYGTVKSTRSSFRDSTRLSVAQLQLLALGAYLDTESLKAFGVVSEIIQKLQLTLMETFKNEAKEKRASSNSTGNGEPFFWRTPETPTTVQALRFLSCFSKGADLYLSGNEVDREMALKLVNYGFRHGKDWFGVSKTTPPLRLFSLTMVKNVLEALKGPLERVTLLRKIFKQTRVLSKDAYLRFLDAEGKEQSFAMQELSVMPGNLEENNGLQPTRRKRTRQTLADYCEGEELENRVFVGKGGVPDAGISDRSAHIDGELNDTFDEWLHEGPRDNLPIFFDILFGNANCAAIYWKRGSKIPKALENITQYDHISPETARDLLHSNSFDNTRLAELIVYAIDSHLAAKHSMLTLAKISNFYDTSFQEARISMSILTKPISSWAWSKSILPRSLEDDHCVINLDPVNFSINLFPESMSRAAGFACVLQCESGTVSTDVETLGDVMAISSGNSLFIAQQLLCDPAPKEIVKPGTIVHVLGNIGKPGVALLVPPGQPEIRKHTIDDWHLSNHIPFDGRRVDGSFEATSLHFSLTGYQSPVSINVSGLRGFDAYFLESRVSLIDGTKWIADLDILKALERDPRVERSPDYDSSCRHNPSIDKLPITITSIDCWEEYIDPPDGIMAVRAGTNWMARLAAISIASTRGDPCSYVPLDSGSCWRCLVNSLQKMENGRAVIVY